MTPTELMDYVIELESYSLLFLPRQVDTEVLQFQRLEYSVQAGEQLVQKLLSLRNPEESGWSRSAAFALLAMFGGDRLHAEYSADGNEVGNWRLVDEDVQHAFCFTNQDNLPVPSEYQELLPDETCLDLIQQLQPVSSRYTIDELITPMNQADSEFVQQKQAMDYLYQRGVFGFVRS